MSQVPRTRRRETQLAFEALSIEGGLLSPEWLARAAQLQAPHQAEADYGIEKGLNIRDEIARSFRMAQAHFRDLSIGLSRARGSAQESTLLPALSEKFVVTLLRKCLGFESLAPTPPVELNGRLFPLGHSAQGRRIPVVIAPAGWGLDTHAPIFGDQGRRRSAFGLVQDYLNAAGEALWGLCCDGQRLRILRDNASLTRPAWIEADLERIFQEERYADYTALWLLAHETRFGRADQAASACVLEAWRAAGQEEGTRAREHLRRGVEEALLALGNGFLAHPKNEGLRQSLHRGELSVPGYFQQLLRLVYRMIFLLTAEERGLLHPEGASMEAQELYAQGYGMRRLRDQCTRRSAHDRHWDLWPALGIVFRGLALGEPRLGLPALAGLFAESQCADLMGAKLENRFLASAIFKLSWLRESSGLARVNWRDMGPEELGSVYESLLELVPQVTQDCRSFAFASGGETKGNARKLSGSYYTPDTLVQVLLNSALEPVVQAAMASRPEQVEEAILNISVVDPACGSGHFLLAAARRLASHLARVVANGTPSALEYRQALRKVVGRCVYGVDLNAMAVELCKLSLWMEAVEPGRPLSFLDSHIRHGNALLGATPELMNSKGIVDEAWEALEGDDKKVAGALKKKNKKGASGQRGFEALWSKGGEVEAAEVARAVEVLEAGSDGSVEGLLEKERRWAGLQEMEAYKHQRLVADAWCSAFVWPKEAGELAEAAPVNEVWRQLRDGQGKVPALLRETVKELREKYGFFHWHLEFPRIFGGGEEGRGGFDVVLGNPPWERVKVQEQEFFASRSEEIAKAANASARKKLIAGLAERDPALWKAWSEASRKAEGESHFVRTSGRFPLCGKGDVNTYALFAEHNRGILGARGRAGFIVPTGIATDDTTKEYFGTLVKDGSLCSLYDFQTGPGLFSEIGHARFKFSLLTLGANQAKSDLVFFARQVSELAELDRHFALSPSDFATLNPNTRTCPTFRSRRDADINLAIYRQAGVLWREDDPNGNPWQLRFMAMFHMSNDSGLFRTRAELLASGHALTNNRFDGPSGLHIPLIEAKMVHHFDHRYGDYADKPQDSENTSLPDVPLQRLQDADYAPIPRYWVRRAEVDERLRDRWSRGWLLGWRDITNATNERTVIACVVPRVAIGNKIPLMISDAEPQLIAALYANLCSFALDYAARQKVGGTTLNYFILKQFPIFPPSTYLAPCPWDNTKNLRDWILPRVLELSFTAWDLQAFANDLGHPGPPFRWDPERRFLLRAELDAAFFHLYQISPDDAAYILDTFPIVKKHDEKNHGHYRTKQKILDIHKKLAHATHGAQAYQSQLDPPPADPRAAHPDRV